MSVLNGMTTIFYLIYFFWWNEMVFKIIDKIFQKYNPNAIIDDDKEPEEKGPVLLMGIYLLFIVIFFGIIANYESSKIVMTNMSILLFKNWFFNINLILVIVERIALHLTKQPIQVFFGALTPNMIVLHISIIFGAFLMFFVVKNFPNFFTPENTWGSIVIIIPFLLLKMMVLYLTKTESN